MADTRKATDGPTPYDRNAFDITQLPDHDTEFIKEEELNAFGRALQAPTSTPVTALNDWRPVHQRVRRRGGGGSKKRKTKRSTDETREGFVYSLLQWPLLLVALAWLAGLGASYLTTRLYIWAYEHVVTWRGQRERLRQTLRSRTAYADWVRTANELDEHLGNDEWKKIEPYAYYDHATVRRVKEQLKTFRKEASESSPNGKSSQHALEQLKKLVEACVKGNFAGTENPRLYSETYYGTKDLVQSFVDELAQSLDFMMNTALLRDGDKFALARHLHTNLGRTALCLSGGAAFAYYHFGVVKALLDAGLLPDVITGTSGGALVAALIATRRDDELKALLVPALAHRIDACSEPFGVWARRWWRTGARFDSITWARKCSWFCRGSLTFREAYERTGRILNITCIPSDPHSPAILANYLTAPDCVIWSACLASAAVPGILNPVVLMSKARDGALHPFSFGHTWKDGSLRTDIPLAALNLHFNVNFSIVSQVNPHINLFFFAPRGAVGRPVTHRRGRGWRGGFLGSAAEQYLKLDLTKWLKVLRDLELLPRPLGQDWSAVWLQNFGGTVTIWPRSRLGDFAHILADPTPRRLADMLHRGQSSAFPKLLFIANRIKIERPIERGLLLGGRRDNGAAHRPPSFHVHGSEMRNSAEEPSAGEDAAVRRRPPRPERTLERHSSGVVEELFRQSGVFFDDVQGEGDEVSDDSAAEEEEEAVEMVEGGPTKVE